MSFLTPEKQQVLLGEFEEHMRIDGMLILGSNEVLSSPNWKPVKPGRVQGFQKK